MVKFGVVDRTFNTIEKHKVSASLLALAAIGLGYAYQTELSAFEKQHHNFLKLLGIFLGPIATAIGFFLSYRSKVEMVEQGKELALKDAEVKQKTSELTKATEQLDAAKTTLDQRERRIVTLQQDIHRITEGASELWKLKPAQPFQKYKEWLHDPKGARLITVGNLKGGVGKTTLAANLAAYISEVKGLPVLLVDLDYQGSLSNMALLTIDKFDIESNVDNLLQHSANLATVVANEIHLAPKLSRGWVIPAGYSLSQLENRLLLRWLTSNDDELDVRYRLAHLFLDPDVRRKYAAIIFDVPPRLALGAINALVASHHLIVPTGFDRLSGESLSQFLSQMKGLSGDMKLSIDLAGIVGMMSKNADLLPSERGVWDDTEVAAHAWRNDFDFRFARTIPKRSAISKAVGEDFAVLLPGKEGEDVRSLMHPLFEQICARIKLDDWR